MDFFILGILCAQFTYITIQWLQLRNHEYLYYGTYILTFIIYVTILFRDGILGYDENSQAYYLLDNFKRPVAFLLYYEYFIFAEYFIGIKSRFPGIYRHIQPFKIIILGFVVVQVLLQVTNTQYSIAGNALYYIFSLFLFGTFVVFFIRLWNTSDRLVRYVLWASLSISVGAFITNLMLIFNFFRWMPDFLMIRYFFIPSCIGVFFEIYFFNTGIAYKISMGQKKLFEQQKDLIRQLSENEKLLIIQQEFRNKLAKDLHDDIGATLSGIALHSHMVNNQIFSNKSEAIINSLNLIENGAVEMVNHLNDVVWAVDPKNDNVEEMLERLKEYTFIMSQAKNIQLKWKVDEEQIRNIILPMDHRRNIYLICKEAINNAVKYSACRQIIISGMHENGMILFCIQDDGKGFDIDDFSRGNGLRNMKERAMECNLDLEIESAEGHGTIISIHYSITQ